MLALTVRCINSFDFGTVFYMPISLPSSATLSDLAAKVREKAESEGRYRPMRPHLAKYDHFKIYVLPGQAKPANLTISPEGREFGPEHMGQALCELGLVSETEISYYNQAEYLKYSAAELQGSRVA